jgi:hypothetical protein
MIDVLHDTQDIASLIRATLLMSRGALMRRICSVGLATAFTMALSGVTPAPATAQTYPSRTVSVIVPYPPGGSVDGVARILVQRVGRISKA